MLISEILDYQAQRQPLARGLIYKGTTYTYKDLADLSTQAGRAAGRMRGHNIAILSQTSAHMVATMFGIGSTSKTVFPINTRNPAPEIGRLLQAAQAITLVYSEEFAAVAREAAMGQDIDLIGIDTIFEKSPSFGDPVRRCGVEDSCWIIATSGSTGNPKLATITHRGLLSAVDNTAMGRPLDPTDVYLYPFPLFHIAAYNLVHHFLKGVPVVMPTRFDLEEIERLIAQHQITSASLAPTMISILLDAGLLGSSLKRVAYGASPITPALMRQALAVGCDLAQGYGMTELCGNAVFLTPDDHRLAATSRPELLASCGKPGPLVKVRIDAAEGLAGEILISGPQLFAGYYNDKAATNEVFDGSWLRTGDIGYLRDGYLYVVDRKKQLIITGGENVSSLKVQNVLCDHPQVKQAAVVGLPHIRWGEQVTAVLVVDPGTSPKQESIYELEAGDESFRSLQDHSRRYLAGFEVPKQIFVVDELPVNAGGKIDKPELIAKLLDHLGNVPTNSL